MRNHSEDLTLQRNYIQKYRFLIDEYVQVKNKTHPVHKYVKDFHEANGTDRRSFLKYYNRFVLSGEEKDFLPRK